MAVWIGGMVFTNFVIIPTMRTAPPEAKPLQGQIMGRFSMLAWISAGLIVLTGILKIIRLGMPVFQTSLGHVIEFKVLVAIVMITLGIIISRRLLPKMGALAQQDGPPPLEEMQALQSRVELLGKINLLLGLLVLVAVALI